MSEELKQYRKSLRVINMANVDSQPVIKEVKGYNNEPFVMYGEKNDYYDRVIESYLGSPTNSRCINGICDMIYGRGLDATNSEERQKDFMEMKRLFNPHEVKKVIGDLKKLGQGTAQVIYNKSKTKILRFVHTPTECWRAGKADSTGTITKYYYHPKWKEYRSTDKLKNLPTFGHGSKDDQIELYIFRPYRSGFYYYSPVDYHGCLPYCDLEEEVAEYHISNIQNGLQPSMLINFNNGVPPEEIQEEMERKITDKFAGASNSGRFILAFNDDIDTSATIEPIHLPDAHAQYQFLADEAREKIMLGHGVVSPILLGIKDNTGFGNNAEELRTSSILMDKMVIQPFKDLMLDGINEILAKNGAFLNTYFVTLQPIEFTDVEKIATKIKREEETGEKLSSVKLTDDFNDEEGDDMLDQLAGLGEEINSDQWELVYSEAITDADNPPSVPEHFNAISARPNDNSTQDQGEYKIRYAYMPIRKSPKSRNFCKHMEGFTEAQIVFRREDINQMSFRGVNRELGHKKRNYSLFKFKGGKNCHHYWEMRVYKRIVSEGERASEGSVSDPKNPKEVPIRPVDMPGNGAHPSTLSKIKKALGL